MRKAQPEMTYLRVALLQLNLIPNDDIANLRQADLACQIAKERGADIALFPEMWNIGYEPRTYERLNDDKVAQPFERKDARK